MHGDALNELDSLLRVLAVEAHEFEQADLWNGVPVAAAGDDESGNDRERERNFHAYGRAGAGFRLHVDGAADFFDVGFDDVHADAATGDVGNFFRSGEAGKENEVDAFALAHARGLFGCDQSFFDGFAADFVGVETAAIVGNLDDDLAAFVIGAEKEAAFGGFADGDAAFGLFDAVIDGISNDVRGRIFDRLDDGLVEFGFFAFHLDAHLFAAHRSDVAHGARKFAPDVADGLHARLHHAFLQFGGDEVEALAGREQTGVFGGVRELENLVAGEDKFADEIHQLVEQRDVDADGAFTGRGARLRLPGGVGVWRNGAVIGGVFRMIGLGFGFRRGFGDGHRDNGEFDRGRRDGCARRRRDGLGRCRLHGRRWLCWR